MQKIIELHGRSVIYYPKTEITNNNIQDIMSVIIPIHDKNAKQENYLWNYYKGKQPVEERTKEVRPEIKRNTVVNHAYEIMNFHLGYIFGDPIQYVQRGVPGAENGYSDVNSVSVLQELMLDDDKITKDRDLGEWMLCTGTGYRMCLPSKEEGKIFETEILDPRNAFVVYDNGFGKKPWLGGVKTINRIKGKETIIYDLYTSKHYYRVNTEKGKCKITKQKQLVLDYVPIIEYPLGSIRLGSFEMVHDIMNAINTVESSRCEAIEQKVQSFLKFINCDIDDKQYEEFKRKGVIKIKVQQGMRGDVEYVTVDLNQTDSQVYVDSLYQKMLQIAGVPDRNASAGGNTGQALIVGQGWSNSEARAKAIELSFRRSENRFLDLVLSIIKKTASADDVLKKLTRIEIEPKFTRNKTDSLLVKTQGLLNMLQAGIHPRIAIAICGLFSDPEQVYTDSQPYLNERWLQETQNKVNAKQIKSVEDVMPKLPVTG